MNPDEVPPGSDRAPVPVSNVKASSSIGRAAVSKTAGWGFDSLLACQRGSAGRRWSSVTRMHDGRRRNDGERVMRLPGKG